MKHAYLIIAHNEFGLLQKLIQMLDDEKNDIYIHIDKKTKNFNPLPIENCAQKSKVVFVERKKVYWGTYSQINVELSLMKKASETYHDFYHLLSGVDLPIKTLTEINEFFEQNKNCEFVPFDSVACSNMKFLDRVRYYNIRLRCLPNRLSTNISNIFIKFQKKLKINRLRKSAIPPEKFRKGSNWFDISHDLTKYVINEMERKEIVRIFKKSSCVDEVFLQTLFFNSSFFSKKSDKSVRYIDWSKHGSSPETLTIDYWDKLKNSSCFFARKFNETKYPDIVDKVFNTWK